MLFATSCQDDLDLANSANEGSVVSFVVNTPQIVSRAADTQFSDGKKATHLQYAFYDANGNILPALTKLNEKINVGTTYQITQKLTTGNKYSVIFWAATPETEEFKSPYTVDFNAKTMQVSYEGVLSNVEERDAFYAYHEFTVTGAQTETIELKRPFAQLNIGTEDLLASKYAGYEVTHSKVTVPVFTTLNMADGTVDGEQRVPFEWANIPSADEAFPVANYEYLAMNYLLVAKEKNTVEVTFEYTDGNASKKRTVGSVPVQRNYRTNIYGQLLTSDVDIKVEIEPEYEKPDYELDPIYHAAAFGGEVTLTEDVTLSTPLFVQANMALNSNGYTLNNVIDGSYGINVIDQANPATVILNETNLVTAGGGIQVAYGANVTFNSGNITINSTTTSQRHNFYAASPGTVVTVNGGEFSFDANRQRSYACAVNGAVIYIKGGTFGVAPNHTRWKHPIYEDGGEVIISGGTFGFDPTEWVAEGYKAIKSGDKWYVGLPVNSDSELQSALGSAVENSTFLLSDNTNYGTIAVSEMKNVTIMGGENTAMRFVTNANSKIVDVTIKEVTFNFATGAGQKGGAFVVIDKDAQVNNLIIENNTIVGDGNKNSYGIYGQNPNATVVVKNCNFSNLGYAIQATAGGGYESLTVEKCTFENINSWVIMPQYGFNGDLTITGCTFKKCSDGLVKTGAFNGSTFTFTNNTIIESAGHDGKDAKWFEVNASTATKVISGNTKDGADWTPDSAEGLK